MVKIHSSRPFFLSMHFNVDEFWRCFRKTKLLAVCVVLILIIQINTFLCENMQICNHIKKPAVKVFQRSLIEIYSVLMCTLRGLKAVVYCWFERKNIKLILICNGTVFSWLFCLSFIFVYASIFSTSKLSMWRKIKFSFSIHFLIVHVIRSKI